MKGPGRPPPRWERTLRLLAVALALVSLALNMAGHWFAYKNTELVGGAVDWAGLVFLLWPVALVVVGMGVALAQPRILVGWGLLAAGLSMHVILFGGAYGGWARLSGSAAPLSGVAIWAGLAASGVFAGVAPLVVTRLPSGHPDTVGARIVSRLSWCLGVALTGWWGFGGETLSVNTLSGSSQGAAPLSSPFISLRLDRGLTGDVTTVLTLALLACFLTSIVLVLVRRRRASRVERAQLRWLGTGLLVLPIVAVLEVLTQGFSGPIVGFLQTLGLVVGLGAIPVSIAASVLKFKLFEIDRFVSRTVTYLTVAVTLAALYAILAVLPFTLLLGMGGGDAPSWLVAASTLTVAMVFNPLRHRVQRSVDRRFNRSRYDAERVVERFVAAARELADATALASGMTVAVRGALEPAALAIWLRSP